MRLWVCVMLQMSALVNMHDCVFRSNGMHKFVCKFMHKCTLKEVNSCVYMFMWWCLGVNMYELLFCDIVYVCL